MKKFVKMMVVMMLMAVTLVTSGTTKVYASTRNIDKIEEYAEKISDKEAEAVEKAIMEQLDSLYHCRDDFENARTERIEKINSAKDFLERYNIDKEYYLKWGEIEAWVTLKQAEYIANQSDIVLTEEDKNVIKSWSTWYETEEELSKYPESPANKYCVIFVYCKIKEGNETDRVNVFPLLKNGTTKVKNLGYTACEGTEGFGLTVTKDSDYCGIICSTSEFALDAFLAKEESMVNGEWLEVSDISATYVLDGVEYSEKTVVDLTKKAVHTLYIGMGVPVKNEEIKTADEVVETLKEEGAIKDIVITKPVEVDFDTVVDINVKTFPVLPVVIASVGAVCVLIGIILVIKKKNEVK